VTSISAESWRGEVTDRPAYGKFHSYRVSPVTDAYIAIDHDQIRHFLLAVSEDSGDINDESSRGLSVRTRVLQVGAEAQRTFIDVRCADASGYEAFDVVVNAVLGSLEGGAAPAEAVRTVIGKWRRFWGAIPDIGLAAEEVRGLFGELWFLRSWLLPLGQKLVLRWVGPTRARHDFQWPGAAVEAKTTNSTRGHIHRINGLEQLQPPQQGTLFFYSLRVREEPSAKWSLPVLVRDIQTYLRDMPEESDIFDARLAEAGYSPAHALRYGSMFHIADERLYRVSAGFPRLTPASFVADLPHGIERIDYVINVDVCPQLVFATSPSQAAEALT
jgi:hypothetical protein